MKASIINQTTTTYYYKWKFLTFSNSKLSWKNVIQLELKSTMLQITDRLLIVIDHGLKIFFSRIIYWFYEPVFAWLRFFSYFHTLVICTLCCKYLGSLACLYIKMPMFQRVGLREGGKPLPIAFQYLILMIWRPCDLNLVMISSLASKYQHFKVGMPVFQPFYVMKLKTSTFKVLAFWSQWRYHDQIQSTRSLYQKNQILKC